MSAFEKGDRVAWSHEEATKHADGSILRASVLGDPGDEPGSGQRGNIVDAANEEGTWWEVQLDGDDETRILTSDELVRIVEED